MCKEANETVSHILNKCSKLTTSNYMKRQQCIRNISQEYMSALRNKTCKTPWNRQHKPLTENKEQRISWDFEIDVAVPLDLKIKDKRDEMTLSYQDF